MARQLSVLLPGPWKTLVDRRQRRQEFIGITMERVFSLIHHRKTPTHHRTERPAATVALVIKKAQLFLVLHFFQALLVTAVPRQVPHELIF